MTYDFSRLSSLDFEELTHDLLQAEWGVRLESFKTGRDNGIDLRSISADDGDTIVQCKEYSGSGLSALLSHLRSKELPKIRALAPARYVLVTSVGLTPHNKDELFSALAPFVRSSEDVFGKNDIEALLRKHSRTRQPTYALCRQQRAEGYRVPNGCWPDRHPCNRQRWRFRCFRIEARCESRSCNRASRPVYGLDQKKYGFWQGRLWSDCREVHK